jgi:hypothetical protein
MSARPSTALKAALAVFKLEGADLCASLRELHQTLADLSLELRFERI